MRFVSPQHPIPHYLCARACLSLRTLMTRPFCMHISHECFAFLLIDSDRYCDRSVMHGLCTG